MNITRDDVLIKNISMQNAVSWGKERKTVL